MYKMSKQKKSPPQRPEGGKVPAGPPESPPTKMCPVNQHKQMAMKGLGR